MKLTEAIRYLERLPDTLGVVLTEEEINAFKLGIEALKRVRSNEYGRSPDKRHLLPGETEE